MKKVFAILVLVLATMTASAGEILEITGVKAGSNSADILVKSEKFDFTINFDEGSKVIFVEFTNSKVTEGFKIPDVKNEFIDKIEYITFENNTDIFITLKKDVFYKSYKMSDEKKLSFEFYKKKNEPKKASIVLDAGHGGKDSGAIGYSGLLEKNIALKVVKMLREALKEDFNVTITRDDDYFIPLPDRPKVANDINADLFVSIHLNAMPDNSAANGVEVFYYSRNESTYAKKISSVENSVDEKFGIKTQVTDIIVNDLFYQINQEKSTVLATIMVDNLTQKTGFNKRPQGGVYGANFAVLRGSKMPAVLIELGFLTNKKEALKLNDEVYQEKMVEAIVEGLKKYFSKG